MYSYKENKHEELRDQHDTVDFSPQASLGKVIKAISKYILIEVKKSKKMENIVCINMEVNGIICASWPITLALLAVHISLS